MISYFANIFSVRSENNNRGLDIDPLKDVILDNLTERKLIYSEKGLYKAGLIIFLSQNGNKVHRVFFDFLWSLSWKSPQARPYHT